jgi:Tol biopolymer transport system component
MSILNRIELPSGIIAGNVDVSPRLPRIEGSMSCENRHQRVGPTIGLWLLISFAADLRAEHPTDTTFPAPLIGYTELETHREGGRHANVRTQRAMLIRIDGSDRREVAADLVDGDDVWTQFAGWSPDGATAIVARGWQDPQNAQWEEEHRTFRMEPGRWLLDCFLVDVETSQTTNITAVDRVSHYNSGLFYLPAGRGFGFTALIGGESVPYLMDAGGRNKRDVSGEGAGFAYGFSASPDGERICYHENYQVYIANADGSERKHVDTGHPFDFAPRWSPDGEWLLFVSGEHGNSDPYIVRADGAGLRKLADLNDYQGWVSFLDVDDFHNGSSDLPVWAADGKSVYLTAAAGGNVELFQVSLTGELRPLSDSPPGTLHYHPTPSPDGRWLMYGSLRDGVRQLYVRNLADHSETQITRLAAGRAAMWPHWQPLPAAER